MRTHVTSAERPILIYDSTAGNPNPPGFLESLTNVRPSRDVSDSFLYNLQADGPVWQLRFLEYTVTPLQGTGEGETGPALVLALARFGLSTG